VNISAGHNKRRQQTIATQKPAPDPRLLFTAREWEAFLALRTCYQQSHDLLSERELTHLRFIRWLRQTGRIAA
jgi:hypothetical protein